jgi:acetamidase/formamidase
LPCEATKLEWPRIETATEWITMGFDEDLTKALANAKAETAKFLVEQRKVSPEQAASMVSKTSDCRVTQVVDIKKVVHCMTSKAPAQRLAETRPTAETPQYLVTGGRQHEQGDGRRLVGNDKGLSRLDAYALASMTMDCRVGEMDAAEKGVHCLVAKSMWKK